MALRLPASHVPEKFHLMAEAQGYRDALVAHMNTRNDRGSSMLIELGEFRYRISGDLSGSPVQCLVLRMVVERVVGEHVATRDIQLMSSISNHSANNSSEASSLKAIQPKIAISSAGNQNRFSHLQNGGTGQAGNQLEYIELSGRHKS